RQHHRAWQRNLPDAQHDERHQLWASGIRGPPAKTARAIETAPRRSPPHTAPRLLKMGKMIRKSAPAWNKTGPHKLPLFCISHPQAIEKPKVMSRKAHKFGA